MSLPALAAVALVTLVTIALGARGMRVARTPADFLVAARQVPPLVNASAISGEYLSAASFLGVAGLVYVNGVGALWYPVGYATGYLVLLLLVAAPLRRFGAYTIPDFAEGRLGSRALRKISTGFVLIIGWFYLLPQLKGAGITLQVVVGSPYCVGVVVLGVVVTANIAAGGMKGITIVQAFQFWLKIVAIAVPALVLLAVAHTSTTSLDRPVGATFPVATTVSITEPIRFTVRHPVTVTASGRLDGRAVAGPVVLAPGRHRVASGSRLRFPAGAAAPSAIGIDELNGSTWSMPFARTGSGAQHPLAATYGLILATFLGTVGLPHILVRFYTNRDGRAARRTTAIVLCMVSAFYLFPVIFAVLGRLEAPGLYLTSDTDSVVLVLPKIAVAGAGGAVLAALVAAGAFAAFLSTSSGLLVSVAGALSHDLLGGSVRAFRWCAVAAGVLATLAGLRVAGFSLNLLVGWAFAIAASTFCPLLVLGIWWRRLTRIGCISGLLVGGLASATAIVATMLGAGQSGWAAVLLGLPAIWSVPTSFLVMIVVSLLTPGSLPDDVKGKMLVLHLPERLRGTGSRSWPTSPPTLARDTG
ncbi:MAG TPA: cation acetate symporter [Mycobacteriales bacterium]|nr:cation acetate symporter [Mycobacteriales bacterium]